MSAVKRYLEAQGERDHSPGPAPAAPLEDRPGDRSTAAGVTDQRKAAYRSSTDGTVRLRKRQSCTIPAALPPPAIRDAEGYNLQPDPLAATTPTELVAALREYRAWADSPPYRAIAAQAHQAVAHSTIYTALNNDTELPRLKVVIAIIAGCGGDDAQQRTWATAWRRIALGKLDAPATAAEPPTLRVIPPAAVAGG